MPRSTTLSLSSELFAWVFRLCALWTGTYHDLQNPATFGSCGADRNFRPASRIFKQSKPPPAVARSDGGIEVGGWFEASDVGELGVTPRTH